MKKVFAVMFTAMLFSCLANADVVNFTTAGQFACNGTASCSSLGSLDTSITIGGVTITFSHQNAGAANPSFPAGVSLGDFSVSGTPLQSFAGTATFGLTIFQTNPSNTSGAIQGGLSGSVQASGGNLFITFGTGTGGNGPGNLLLVNGSGTGANYQITFDNSGVAPNGSSV